MITVIDYGTGNLGSIVNIGKKAGGKLRISSDPAVIRDSEKLILPGVGSFDRGMQNLQDRGLVDVLTAEVLIQKKPILGICLGVQLFMRRSDEGMLPGLGWVPGETVKFNMPAEASNHPIPHMGWNEIIPLREDRLLNNLPECPRFYFVHSFHLKCDDPDHVLAWTDYGLRFACAIQKENIWGTQFHPEKSHKFGLQVMKNFVSL
jgi:glutamine amidotransferase